MGTDTLESGIEQIVGGPFDDVIEGNEEFNVLIGLAGNDTISALGGDFDALVGGAGDDALDGGDGVDFAENYFVDVFMSPDILAGPVTVNLTTGRSFSFRAESRGRTNPSGDRYKGPMRSVRILVALGMTAAA